MSQHHGAPAPNAGIQLVHSALDAVIVTPPLSPTDTNPPLGPAILAMTGHRRGLSITSYDLNIRYLNRFSVKSGASPSGAPVGDQNKDREITHAARAHFLSACPLAAATPLHAADGVNPLLGVNFSFEDVEDAVESASRPGHFWHDFIRATLFRDIGAAPRVLGLSIMGPPQLFVSMVVARMAAERWPDTLIVAGGSHVTLLRRDIAVEARYGSFFHGFMPHHCEHEFAGLLAALRRGEDWRVQRGVLMAGSGREASVPPPHRQDFEIEPLFADEQLKLYSSTALTIPLQLTRGCSYGKCAHCTYPKAEPTPTGFDRVRAARAADVFERFAKRGCRRFSIKDSLFSPRWMTMLADELTKRHLYVQWSCTTLIDERQPEALLSAIRMAAGAGLRTMEFGVETIHPHLQQLIGKVQPVELVERVIAECASAGVHAVINLIYGLPGETMEEARAQLSWFNSLRDRFGAAFVSGSHNLLEVDLDTPMQLKPEVHLRGRAPWGFSFAWAAPDWRPTFEPEMLEVSLANDVPVLPPLVVITGPGGSGKSTVAQRLCEMPAFQWHLSVTTRPQRSGVELAEYRHVTFDEFRELEQSGQLIDTHESPSHHKYGLTAPERTKGGLVPVLISSAEGVERIRSALRGLWQVIVVLLDAPEDVLEQRIRSRGDGEGEIAERLNLAQRERSPAGGADLVCSGGDSWTAARRVHQHVARFRRGDTGSVVGVSGPTVSVHPTTQSGLHSRDLL